MLRVGDVIERNSDGWQWLILETGIEWFDEDAVLLRLIKGNTKYSIGPEKCVTAGLCEPTFTIVKKGCVFNDNN